METSAEQSLGVPGWNGRDPFHGVDRSMGGQHHFGRRDGASADVPGSAAVSPAVALGASRWGASSCSDRSRGLDSQSSAWLPCSAPVWASRPRSELPGATA